MRRWVSAVVAWLAIASLCAAAVPLCDYSSPETNLSDLSLRFSYSYHNDPYGLEELDSIDGEFIVDYVRIYDAPIYGYDVTVNNEVTSTSAESLAYETVADGNYKRYFVSENDFFAFAGSSARTSSSYEGLGVSCNLGIGFGRFNDVTPMAKATRIDEVLLARATLTDHLHPVDIEFIAREIGSRASYASLADLLAEIQDAIEDSGRVALRGLDALDISEITRLVQDDGLSRYCGWDFKLGLGYQLLDPSGDLNDLLITSAFNYALATTPRVQFLIQGTLSGPPALLDTHRIDLKASYDCLVWDFLSLTSSYAFVRETWDSEPTDTHRVTLDLVLSPLETAQVVIGARLERLPYYLEWDADLSVSIEMDLL